jgi:tetratricopeptide (TPR) repeat protein
MGNAYTAVADDVYSIYYNPAGRASVPRPELGSAYAKLYPGLSDNSNISNTFLGYAQPYGEHGGFGAALNYFTLDSLYRETSIFGSYGHELVKDKLDGGLSLKYLNRGLNAGALATQPIGPTGQVVLGTDKVLTNSSHSNWDADTGLLYRVDQRWTVGLAVQHLLEPNIAFGSASDPLARNYKIGGAYKTPFSLLSAELDNTTSPDLKRDLTATLAAEKWLPTLQFGTFGIRGALSAGTRDYRQMNFGLSYKIYKMEFDYGMSVPISGISGTFGTQRIGLTFYFGSSRVAEPLISEALLENMGQLAGAGTPEYHAVLAEMGRYQQVALEGVLSQARILTSEGRFADAYDSLRQAVAISSGDAKLSTNASRLKAVAVIYPEVRNFAVDPIAAAVYESILNFVSGHDEAALNSLAYAKSIATADDKIGYLQSIVKGMVQESAAIAAQAKPAPAAAAPAAVPAPPMIQPVELSITSAPAASQGAQAVAVATPTPTAQAPVAMSSAPAVAESNLPAQPGQDAVDAAVQSDLMLMAESLTNRQYGKVLELGRQVVKLAPDNATAHLRMGTAYYALKLYPQAIESLRKAMGLTQDAKVRKTLNSYLKAIAQVASQKPRSRNSASPQEIENLYNAGVEFYTQGRLSEARRMFQRMLELDSENIPASKALKRVEAEMRESGEGK